MPRTPQPGSPESYKKRITARGSGDRSRFVGLHAEGRRLITSWAGRASDQARCDDTDSFEPFIFGWIAVNGWASCVTGKEGDWACLDAVMIDNELNCRFAKGVAENADLKESLQQFQRLWPIFRSRDIGYLQDPTETREELVNKYMTKSAPPPHRPSCSLKHRTGGHEVPMDLSHTVSAIYQVRCNLFHGFKGVHSENDVSIVSKAFRVLVHITPSTKLVTH